MDTPQIDDLIILLGQISAAIIAISGVGAIAYKLFFKKLADQITKINAELHPNGGSSLRDAVDRIADTQEHLREDIAAVRDKIDDHIVWHLDN